MWQDDQLVINNRYQLSDKIGAGSMGVVFRATDRLTGQVVALKRVTLIGAELQVASDSGATDYRLALTHEFQTLASLHHPHIISVMDYGFDAERLPYFTMSLLEDARTIMEAGREMTLAGKVRLLIEMLQALAYLHRHGIFHRDLKPGNVLVDTEGQVKVLDFGLAVEEQQRDGLVAGTLAYIAPEILMQKGATKASDLYSAGAMAYELLAGHYPFSNENVTEMINQILTARPDLSRLPEENTHLREILGRLLQKDPDSRYQYADSVIRELSQAIGQPVPEESVAIRESFLQAAKFVGRKRELGKLSDALEMAVAGNGSAWIIGGESGVGKSRLLDELRTQALVRGVLALRGQGVAEGGLPYQLWREPIRRLVLSTDLSDLEAGILKELVPDIANLLEREVPDVPALEGEAHQQRLMLTGLDLFRRQTQPMILLLEDLQWARESLLPLSQFGLVIGDLPLLVVATFRSDERPNLPEKVPTMQSITLPRLSAGEIAELSASMLGEAGERPQVLTLLQRETEGNAFFLVEVVRALAEGAGRLSEVGQSPLPETVFAGGVQQVVQRRLSRVPESAQSLIKLAAVAGRQLDMAFLERTLGQEMDIDDQLIACSNVAVMDVQEGRWRFAHEKLRAGVLDSLSENERPQLHRQVAEAIEAIYPDDNAQAFMLMEHWGVAGNRDKEAHYARIAGEQATAVSDFREALTMFERALAMTSEDDLHNRAALLVELGDSYEGLSDYAMAMQYLEQGLELAQEGDAKATEVRALTMLGGVASRRGEYASSQRWVEQGLALAREIGDQQGIADSLRGLGNSAFNRGEYPTAQDFYQEALEINRELGDRRGIASSLRSLGNAALHQGEYETAQRYYEEGLAINRELGDRRGAATSLNNLGNIANHRQEYDAAQGYFDEGATIFRAIGDRSGAAVCLDNLGHLTAAQGKLDDSWRYFYDTLVVSTAIHFAALTLDAVGGIARLYARTEEPIRAAELLGLVMNHPGAVGETRDAAELVLDDLREVLGDEAFDAAMERGKQLNLDRTVQAILLDRRSSSQ